MQKRQRGNVFDAVTDNRSPRRGHRVCGLAFTEHAGHGSDESSAVHIGRGLLGYLQDRRGVTYADFLITLVPFIAVLLMVLSVGLSWHQLQVVRQIKNFYLERTLAEGQLTTEDLADLTADFTNAGFTIQKVEVTDKDGVIIGTDSTEAVIRDTKVLRNSQLTLTLEVVPEKPPFAAGTMFGKTGPSGFYYVTKGRGHSELPRRD